MSLRCTSAAAPRGSRSRGGGCGVTARPHPQGSKSVRFLRSLCSVKSMVGKLVLPAGTTTARRVPVGSRRRMPTVRAIGDPGQSTFLSLEEAGLIDMTALDMHEKFLARLTVSSLNLLRAIAEQEGLPIEDLNAGKVCDWFVKDKEKRAKNIDEATLKWDAQGW